MREERVLLKDQAYERLKELVLSEALPPGGFLSERQLAARLGMSKTPVKAGLERLAHEGFLTISPQQGVVVREIPAREIVDLFDIRIALETFTVQRLAGRLTPEQAARLGANVDAQRGAIPQGDVRLSTALDEEFHLLLSEFLGNQEVLRVMLSLRDRLTRVISWVFRRAPNRFEASFQDHERILSAVLAGDADLASERVREHLEFGKVFLVTLR
ncbi:GntR family transcriptional regulator [Deinococcus planocerae]|uniref:GntR family transcriptional regulator n=1 Tax=Deinococcus planocerae TaxID=1737569 RepID=UPI000C7E963B|nr:GntR family transcriptional regulator [Deinococcus planocerae]